jgi:hypothetical protein
VQLVVDADGPALGLFDAMGDGLAVLAGGGTPGLFLADASGDCGAVLAAAEDKPGLVLFDAARKSLEEPTVFEAGSWQDLSDAMDKPIWCAP